MTCIIHICPTCVHVGDVGHTEVLHQDLMNERAGKSTHTHVHTRTRTPLDNHVTEPPGKEEHDSVSHKDAKLEADKRLILFKASSVISKNCFLGVVMEFPSLGCILKTELESL